MNSPIFSPRSSSKRQLSHWMAKVAILIALTLAGMSASASPLEVRTEAQLIDAINMANSSSSEIAIFFPDSPGAIFLSAPLPAIRGDMDISGSGESEFVLSGAGMHRVFFVDGGTVSIRKLTIADGFDHGGTGALGQEGGAGGGAAGMGGGIFINAGEVLIDRVTFINCTVFGGDGGARFDPGTAHPGNEGGSGGAGMAGDGMLNANDDLGGDGGISGLLGGLEGFGGNLGEAGANGGEGAGGGGGGKGRTFDSSGALAVEAMALDSSIEDAGPGSVGETGGAGGAGGFGAGGGGGGEGGRGEFSESSTAESTGKGGAGGDGGHGGFGGGGGAGLGRSGAGDGKPGLGGLFGGDAGPNGSKGGGGGGAGLGGAMFIRSGSKVTIQFSSFLDNAAVGGLGGESRGGSNGSDGLGKAGAIFIDEGANVIGGANTFIDNTANSATASGSDNDDVFAFGENPLARSGSGSGGCFIATAAYGTPMAGEINALRDARDTYLLSNLAGTVFVDTYYRLSPPIADVVADQPLLGAAVRLVLSPILFLSELLLQSPAGFGIGVLALLGGSLCMAGRNPLRAQKVRVEKRR